MRQIVLDTETTGIDYNQGHKIIEIGCLELIDRNLTGKTFHAYLNPNRAIDAGALAVHGISEEFLSKQPIFEKIVDSLLAFIHGAELIIHNAPFDVGFLNAELAAIGQTYKKIEDYCSVLDTLPLARKLHPGQRNNLDALCKRYSVNNSQRNFHGALLDSELLARVYLAMTGGQATFFTELSEASSPQKTHAAKKNPKKTALPTSLQVLNATAEELKNHQRYLELIAKKAKKGALAWPEN